MSSSSAELYAVIRVQSDKVVCRRETESREQCLNRLVLKSSTKLLKIYKTKKRTKVKHQWASRLKSCTRAASSGCGVHAHMSSHSCSGLLRVHQHRPTQCSEQEIARIALINNTVKLAICSPTPMQQAHDAHHMWCSDRQSSQITAMSATCMECALRKEACSEDGCSPGAVVIDARS